MNRKILYTAILGTTLLGGCTGDTTTTQTEQETQLTPMKMIDIPNAKNPLPNVLTGGQPTPEQVEQLQAAGYKTIINLRTANEEGTWNEASKVAELGMHYIHIPVSGKSDLTKENANAMMNAIQKHSNHPVMVHCGSGNRIGALFAIDAKFNKNQTTEEAIETGINSGLTSLKPAVEEYFEVN